MQQQIAILGGTFDPVHNGHIEIAKIVLEKLNFDKIIFIPNRIPPHKSATSTSKEHRLTMLKLAIAQNSKFSIDTSEFDRNGPSYMLDTLKELKSKDDYKNKNIWLIIGSDVLPELPNWHKWDELKDICNFIVLNRTPQPGTNNYNSNSHANIMSEYLVKNQIHLDDLKSSDLITGKFLLINNELINISATEIRVLLNNYYHANDGHQLHKSNQIKQELSTLLPTNILSYILINELYHN